MSDLIVSDIICFQKQNKSPPQITSEYYLKVFWLIYVHVILCMWKPLCMHVACMVVTACNLLSPVVDIFYLIFILMITVLVCLMYMGKKKLFRGFAPMPSPGQGITLDPLGAYNSPPPLPKPPIAIIFGNRLWLHQKPMHPYFFCIIPWSHR